MNSKKFTAERRRDAEENMMEHRTPGIFLVLFLGGFASRRFKFPFASIDRSEGRSRVGMCGSRRGGSRFFRRTHGHAG